MSPGAAKSAGMMMARTAISREFDIDTHVATRQKEANRMAGLSLVNAAAISTGRTAMDDGRFGAAVGDIKHGVGMQMQGPIEPHLRTDPETGATSIDDSTPEGANAKASYKANVDTGGGAAWIRPARTRISAVAGPLKAQEIFDANKDSIPPVAAAHIQASLAPQVYQAHVGQAFPTGWRTRNALMPST